MTQLNMPMVSGNTDYSPRYDTYTSDEYPPDWQARRRKVLKRDGYVCQACGVQSTRVDDIRFDVDHIVPKSDGGSHALDNLQTLCPSCHADKHGNNKKLNRRGQQFKQRNKPSLLIRLIWLLLGPFLSSVGPDERTVIDDSGRRLHLRTLSEASALPKESGVSVEVTVTELWDSDSSSVKQLGQVRDGPSRYSGTDESQSGNPVEARFVVWSGNEHPRLQKGGSYRVVGAKTNSYDGEFQLIVDGKTAIQVL